MQKKRIPVLADILHNPAFLNLCISDKYYFHIRMLLTNMENVCIIYL